ncbi:nucleoside hydrolase [Actinosynnema pretiosum subsp. pretiosum]|uniref:Nucleoside hydrolase n=1 Tax=Actinosynnema pretiosum subsp. pretiosum TaxID=103721 RepID=A0AA45R4K7_9PSEU|nr:Inosine-uridine preferring nucleoside hydrolase [Actinosynnema pretiosum subsp. pretiosum]QUF04725.1 nucleoside hydrolase [Actinosynnema pretiosum subsp. pretiosum]
MRIVLDTDPGIDDALAIFYLAAHRDVAELVAVGSVHGNVPSPTAAANALRLLDRVGWTEVPVAVGAHQPLAQELSTGEVVHGGDGLAGVAGPPSGRVPVGVSAAEQLVGLARAHPGELTVIALGPLTNIALAALIEPDLPELLRSVTVMGGAIGTAGNITPHAEANIWHDPEAAATVLGKGFDLTLVGLEVTANAQVDAAWVEDLAGSGGPNAVFAADLLRHYLGVYSRLLGQDTCYLHDPLAVAVTLDPGLAATQDLVVDVELRDPDTRGKTTVGETTGRPAVRTLDRVDVTTCLDRLSAALRG